MKLARVFPSRTNMSPTDKDAYYGPPDMFTPQYDEVHISVVFTWDIEKAQWLRIQWQGHARIIKIGGPAMGSPAGEFVPGKYLKHGVTITSRGCPNQCKHCLVPVQEGDIKEINIAPGRIVQDNNLLACSAEHLERVFQMLAKQHDIELRGGLESHRITPDIARRLKKIKVQKIWLACDTDGALPGLLKAVHILEEAGFKRHHLYCYALIGDDMEKNEKRLRAIWDAGCMPFAQLYQPEDRFITYPWAWKRFVRTWSKPQIIRTRAKHGWIKWT